MGSPLGDFLRAKRDNVQPETVGLPQRQNRRAPGLRRTEVAERAGISVEYLTRIEQGRDRHPSPMVVRALADALALDAPDREHLTYMAKISSGVCAAQPSSPPSREVRATAAETLRLLEPAVAVVANRLGDILASTSGFDQVMRPTGMLDVDEPNLTRYVFTDPRARTLFPDWEQVADEQAYDLWLGPSKASVEWHAEQLTTAAGEEFTSRYKPHVPPRRVPLIIDHPSGQRMRWNRERMELQGAGGQEIVVYLPADDATAQAVDELRATRRLRAVT